MNFRQNLRIPDIVWHKVGRLITFSSVAQKVYMSMRSNKKDFTTVKHV